MCVPVLRPRHLLRELVEVWQDTRGLVLIAQVAAVYAALLIPFKMGIPLIPGFSELRPANAFPIVASLLFGPAAAWGSGFGNLIGDCFGTLGPSSLFGFLGNFVYGYLPHLLWGRLGPVSSRRSPEPASFLQALEFAVVCVLASAACASLIAAGVHLLGLLPFHVLFPAILFNNVAMSLLLAPPLLSFLHPRVTRWGLLYRDIVASDTLGVRSEVTTTGSRQTSPGSPHSSHLTPHLLSIEDLSFTYAGGDRPALQGVTLTAQRGDWVAVMGRTGAGKSTLCYALNGLVPQLLPGRWSGRILVEGTDTTLRPIPELAALVGVVFQDFEAQLVSSSVRMELAFPLQQLRTPLTPAAMRERIARTLTRLGLAGLEPRNPHSLSGGQRQRLVMASILIREPALLALDEPLTDLDPEGRRSFLTLAREFAAAGMTLVVADHDPDEAALADRVCVLDRGRVCWEGPPRALFAQRTLCHRFGVRPLPLAEAFTAAGIEETPLTVEEAWALADQHGLTVAPPLAASPTPPVAADRPGVLEVQDVSYAYPEGPVALSHISLLVRAGEFVAIIGQNGSGKSTLAGLLNGLIAPSAGRLRVDGRDTRDMRPAELAGLIGHVFQNPDHQIFAETVGEEVAFSARNLGCTPDEIEERVQESLAAVGLSADRIRSQDPFSLPKGDRQRVAVASTLAARPSILIFDEPTTGLDAEDTDRMLAMIQRLNREGHTVLMITHALSLVAACARRCVVLHGGRVLADGPTRDIFRRLCADEKLAQAGLEAPPLTRFAARWGHTILTVEELRVALRPR